MLKLGFFGLAIAITAACGVYGLKNRVQLLERELVSVEHKIQKERIEIKRLNAEWATLTHPERLARLSAAHLDLEPAEPLQIRTIADIPLRDELGPPDGPALVSSKLSPSASLRSSSLRQ
ncbi:MAG: cell division protein FtsL [Geminicoccaceae bacterium]